MTLKKTQKLAYKWFKKIAEKRVSEKLEHDLESSHSEIRGAVYLSVTMLYSILGMIISFVVLSLLVFIILPSFKIYLSTIMTGFFLFLSVLIGVCIYFISLQIPGSIAKSRGKKIDRNLPYQRESFCSVGCQPVG